MAGHWYRCALLLSGIRHLPTEAVAASDTTGQYDEYVTAMHARLKQLLPQGSVAPIHVQPKNYGGLEIVPVLVGRKAPRRFDGRNMSDDGGMLRTGDTLVYIRDIVSDDDVAVVSGQFKLPRIVDESKMQAIPLSVFVGMGSHQCST